MPGRKSSAIAGRVMECLLPLLNVQPSLTPCPIPIPSRRCPQLSPTIVAVLPSSIIGRKETLVVSQNAQETPRPRIQIQSPPGLTPLPPCLSSLEHCIAL
ncbi:hypothetical protein CGRA01v4_11206 [Colletotrichum graminicola]|nr:hypothetical protein CGRA01v4_11206 [Colletotrichum graminicola]